MTDEKDDESISPEQIQYLLESLPNVRRFVARKLGKAYHSAVEDILQRVSLKLWRWKQARLNGSEHEYNNKNSNKNGNENLSANSEGKELSLSAEEWQKMASTIARHEVIDFFREKYTRRDVPFSQLDEDTKEKIFSVASHAPDQNPEGNSRAELCSQVRLIWRAAQHLASVRQKYAYFLSFPDFIVEFIVCECCSIEKLAVYLETDEKGLSQIVSNLPLTDEEIGRLLEVNFGEQLSPKQMWEARAKAKRKLAQKLVEYISDERLFIQRGDWTLK